MIYLIINFQFLEAFRNNIILNLDNDMTFLNQTVSNNETRVKIRY
jgi:hypothetical protein